MRPAFAGRGMDHLDRQAAGRMAVADLKGRLSARRDPLGGLLGILGHSNDCIAGTRSGRLLSCGCRTKAMDDPAIAVALALHFARQTAGTGIPIPSGIIRLLTEQIEKGDPACLAVGRWLDRRGLLNGPVPEPDHGGAQ